VRDHLAREDRLGPDVVRDRGQDRRVLGQVQRPARPPAWILRGAEVRDGVHRVGCRTPVAEREQPTARLEVVAQPRCGSRELVAIVGEGLCAQLADLRRLGEDGPAHIVDDRFEIVLALAQERVEEAGGAGVVELTGVAALEQTAMVEEHVHQLPEHVVERLDELLVNGRVSRRRLELPLGADRRERERQAAALPRDRERRGDLAGAEADSDVVGLREEAHLLGQRPTLAGEPDRGQGALADDDRVHELDRDVSGVRACGRRSPEGDQPTPTSEPLGHAMAEPGQALGLGVEELRVRARALGQTRDEQVALERLGHAGASSGAPIRVSQSRHSSMPSPVFALTTMRSTPGWTPSRW
jgi:hypothetical protein